MFIRIEAEWWDPRLKGWGKKRMYVINVTQIGCLMLTEGMSYFDIHGVEYRIEEEATSILMTAIEKLGLM